MEVNVNNIIECAESCDLDVQSYSGRGMYGRQCVGIVCADPYNTILSLALEIAAQAINSGTNIDDINYDIIEALGDPRTDSLGKSDTILYWPDLEWPEEEQDEEK